MTIKDLPKNKFALISDPDCWAHKMIIYRDKHNSLFVFDTRSRTITNVSWEENKDNLFMPGINLFYGDLEV